MDTSKDSKEEIKEIVDCEEFVKFEDALKIAKAELLSSLKLKQQNIKDSSTDELIAEKRKLHRYQIKNSELIQEVSQLKEEKNSCQLLLELAQSNERHLEEKLHEEERHKKEVEARLTKSFQLRLSQKDEEIQRLTSLLSSYSSSGNSFSPSDSQQQRVQLLQQPQIQFNQIRNEQASAFLHGRETETEEEQTTTTNTDLRVTLNINSNRTLDNSNLNPPTSSSPPRFRILTEKELGEQPSEENHDGGCCGEKTNTSNYEESRVSGLPVYTHSNSPNAPSIQSRIHTGQSKTEIIGEVYNRLNDCGSDADLYNPEFPINREDDREPVPYTPASPTPEDQLGLIRQIKIEVGQASRPWSNYAQSETYTNNNDTELEQENYENGHESHNTEKNQSDTSDFDQTNYPEADHQPQSSPASPEESEEEEGLLWWQKKRLLSAKCVQELKGKTQIEKRTAVKIEIGLEQTSNENENDHGNETVYPNSSSSPAPSSLPLKSISTDLFNLNSSYSPLSSSSSSASSTCSTTNFTNPIPGPHTIDRRRASSASFNSISSCDSTVLCGSETTTTIINNSNNNEDKEQIPKYHLEKRPISVMLKQKDKQKRPSSSPSPGITTKTTTTTTNDSVSSPKRRRRISDASSCESGSGYSGNLNTNVNISSQISTSLKDIPELYRQNYGFTNNWDMDKCIKSRDFWYESEATTKYLIRFYDDEACDERWLKRKLHVKHQIGLTEPQVLLLKYREILVKLQTHQNKMNERECDRKDDDGLNSEVRVWMDVRDFFIGRDLARFFLDFGSLITHFSFGPCLYSSSEEICPYSLLNTILESMPSLEYLAINDNMLKRINSHEKVKKVSSNLLLHLKTIRFLSVYFRLTTPFIIELILRTPALQEIYGMPLHCIPQIEQFFMKKPNQQIHAPPWIISDNNHNQNVKQTSIDYFNVSAGEESESENSFTLDLKGHIRKINLNMDCIKSVKNDRSLYNTRSSEERNYFYDLTALQRLGISLEKVDTRVFFLSLKNKPLRVQCKEKWSEILKNYDAANKIKILKIEPSERDTTAINFPLMENCETLYFNIWISIRINQGYFPPGFNIRHTFPSLNTVEIYLDEKSSCSLTTTGDSYRGKKTDEILSVHFPSDIFHADNFPNVKKLNLINFMPRDSIERFQKLFPNITILNLKHLLSEISARLPLVFKNWPGLKHLILEMSFFGHANFNLDSAFTGMHYSKCRQLEKMSSEPKMIQERINQYQQDASIANLKDLSLLKIVLLNCQPMDDRQLGDCIMTPVSALYGFGPNRMPDLKVVVGFDERVGHKDKSSILRILEPMRPFLTIDDWP